MNTVFTRPLSFPAVSLPGILLVALFGLVPSALPQEAPFVAISPNEPPAPIVVNLPPDSQERYDWMESKHPNGRWEVMGHPRRDLILAISYLRDAVKKMTGVELPVRVDQDLSRGIVLTTLKHAPEELKNDPEIVEALRDTGEDAYNAKEAYYVRSEPGRVLIVANTEAGICLGVVELLESVDYEVLGMGPNWTHVPDYHSRPLTFSLRESGRPGYHYRKLWATSGQARGVGTLLDHPPDPADEPVGTSYDRWRVGTRTATHSMPSFPGHALQKYHQPVVNFMRKTGSTEGFLAPKINIGPLSQRPPASEANLGHLWIDETHDGPAFLSTGEEWNEEKPTALRVKLDLSVPFVRELILEDMKRQAEKHFEKSPDAIFVFGTDPEDGGRGGYEAIAERMQYPDWYPKYLAAEGEKFGKPYVLDGFQGLDQPNELWDPASVSDVVFGFNNWLLREFTKWLDSLPEGEQTTPAGKPWKEQVLCSFYCYNYHDVPPNFNLDPRIRVMIADFPKHRGRGKWKNFASKRDMATAFQIMLPDEPSGFYRILSLAYFRDQTPLQGITSIDTPEIISEYLRSLYQGGFRAFSCETDFNFGKLGLTYYLFAKMLWNPELNSAELTALRDRWLQLSFGNGWKEMKEYYEFMAPERFVVSAPGNWAKAIQKIDAADVAIDAQTEPAAQRRIDDLKQFWYFYYLVDSGQTQPPSDALREFVWKGQMSYMTAMHMVMRRFFNRKTDPREIAGKWNKGPARYTHEETQDWWAKVRDRWPLVAVSNFSDATLADGTKGSQVDLLDLASVSEFCDPQTSGKNAFRYHAGSSGQDAGFLTTAQEGEDVGFKIFWPWEDERRYRRARSVDYGISYWDTEEDAWEEIVDIAMSSKPSQAITLPDGRPYQFVEVRHPASRSGTYRVDIGRAGDNASLTPLIWDPIEENSSETTGHTYFSNLRGLTQSGVWLYIPQGTKSLDFEVWDNYGKKTVQLHQGLPATGMSRTRSVDVGASGTHAVALEPGEAGSLVLIEGDGFAFPYLYSIPTLWAKTPSALMVPKSIAKADGLTIQ